MPAQPVITLRADLADAARAAGVVDALAGMAGHPEMLRAFDRAAQQLVRVAMEERFTGKGPYPVSEKKLGVVTGQMRRLLYAAEAARTEKGISVRVGSAVEYFAAHELGFDGDVSVRQHARSRHTMKSKRYSRMEQSVRAHTRHMHVPKREPLMAAIRDHASALFGAELIRTIQSIAAMEGGPA